MIVAEIIPLATLISILSLISTESISLTNLLPETDYELTFKYTHMLEGLVREEVIDKQNVTTRFPNITLTVNKVTSKSLYYKIDTSTYTIDSAVLRIYVNGEKQNIELPINIVGQIKKESLFNKKHNTYKRIKP